LKDGFGISVDPSLFFIVWSLLVAFISLNCFCGPVVFTNIKQTSMLVLEGDDQTILYTLRAWLETIIIGYKMTLAVHDLYQPVSDSYPRSATRLGECKKISRECSATPRPSDYTE